VTYGAEGAAFLPGTVSAAAPVPGVKGRVNTGRRPGFVIGRLQHRHNGDVSVFTGALARIEGDRAFADVLFTIGTIPVAIGLAVSIVRDFLAGRLGVDAIALVSMTSALALGEPLAGAVVALMYSGGNVLDDLAVARAERDLRLLIDRAPRMAHRCADGGIIELPIGEVSIGDRLLVRAGEIVPVDGLVSSDKAVIDESAVTGEPIPVIKTRLRARTFAAVPRRPLRAAVSTHHARRVGRLRQPGSHLGRQVA
jgi:cation transport ATPase